MRKRRPRTWLKGKVVGFNLNPIRHRGRCGFYMGRVVRIIDGARMGFRAVVVCTASYPAWYQGPRMRIDVHELTGVEYRGSIVPLNECIEGM